MLRFVRSWSANSNFADNSAVNGGGGISNLGGTLTLKDSFFIRNVASDGG